MYVLQGGFFENCAGKARKYIMQFLIVNAGKAGKKILHVINVLSLVLF